MEQSDQSGSHIHEFNAPYIIRPSPNGNRYAFYCQVTGKEVFLTNPIQSKNSPDALRIAKMEARPYFNRCYRCGRWICDEAYNIDEMVCTQCILDAHNNK